MNILEIKNLKYNYKYKNIFNNLNLDVSEGSFLTICGKSGSGKTTLLKAIIGLLNVEGEIKVNNLKLNNKNINKIRKNIAVVFENPDNSLIEDTVIENITVPLQNIGLDNKEINKRLEKIETYLKIKDLYDVATTSLSGGEKQLVSFAIALSKFPKLILLDDFSSMIDGVTKEKLFKILKKINKEEKITIINFTSDTEDSLYGKEICLLNNGEIILKEKIKDAFNDDKIFKKCNLELPFIADLCNKLKYYNLIDKIIFNKDKLVNSIWK